MRCGVGTDIYEDYKFVTRDELKRLSLQHLIGTPLLKVGSCSWSNTRSTPYMRLRGSDVC